MEAYLPSTKPGHDPSTARASSLKPFIVADASTSSSRRAGSLNPAQGKARPYESLTDAPKASASLSSKNIVQGGLRDRNKAIIKTLGKEDNPITNSTAYSRTMHIQSCATGHQSGGGGGRWTLHRNAKLRLQAAESETQALKGVIAYINGYTGRDITNTQLKELVERQGGSFVTVASARVTHIFVTENLSAKKAQHYLEARRKNGTKLVTPQWAIACAEKGRRVSEARYAAPVFNELQESTYKIFSRSSNPPEETAQSKLSLSPARPRARTRSSSKQSVSTPEPASSSDPTPQTPPSGLSNLLPAPPISPLRRSPRRFFSSSSASTHTTTAPPTTTSATALLLAEIKAAKAQRSPSRSPASKDAERKRGWCATWDCVVESPGRKKRRLGKLKEKENTACRGGKEAKGARSMGTKGTKQRKEEEVIVLVSSDAEEDVAASCSRPLPPHARSISESEDDERAGRDHDVEEEDWSLPPSAQKR
ncbi:hypothetical protein JCM10908_001129 [Rhodotorula pacifica]|uniref:uncharacterized protein n=1 Tax=Rhodotorula pacifica TaxID=1495444 RepID=UPI00317A2D6A